MLRDILLTIITLFNILILFTSCRTIPPEIYVKTWAGDSKRSQITRMQDGKHIKCSSQRFDDYVCMSYEDISAILRWVSRWKEWE